VPPLTIFVREADVELFERARRFAERRRMSLSALIAAAIEQYLEDQK
jgi:predicted transcriptional regulator